MKRWQITLGVFIALFAIVAILLLINPSLATDSDISQLAPSNSNILTLLEEYGYPILSLEKTLQQLPTHNMEPITVNLDDVQILINELVYDGVWLYTAALIKPKDPQSVLILPGAAFITDLVNGCHDENKRDDQRSFIDAARADGKRLLAVYVYPKEFDSCERYFMDYFQHSNDISVFMSGAEINPQNGSTTVTWSIQVYEVDLATEAYTMLTAIESMPQNVQPMGNIEYQDYNLVSQSDAPCNQITLVKTMMTTYGRVKWNTKSNPNENYITMLDESGRQVEHGMSVDLYSFALTKLPDYFEIEINGNDTPRYRFEKAD